MQSISLVVILVSGLWLIGVGLLMAIRPAYGLHLFVVMSDRLNASDWRLHIFEQSLRLLAGASLIVRSPLSKAPWIFFVFGWMIVLSSVIIMVLPVRWHGRFGLWWSDRLTSGVLRILSPVPILMGSALMFLAV